MLAAAACHTPGLAEQGAPVARAVARMQRFNYDHGMQGALSLRRLRREG